MEILNRITVRQNFSEALQLSVRDYRRLIGGEENIASYGFVRKASIVGSHFRTGTPSHVDPVRPAQPSISATASAEDGTYSFSSPTCHIGMLI
jgi:hypothetical protein